MAVLSNVGEQPNLFKLYVGQIPKDVDELTLRQYFEEYGHIVEVSIIRDNILMMSKGCAFVTYSHENAAQLAVDKLHDQLQLPNALNPLQVRFAATQADRNNKLFIGMLPKMMGDQDLYDMFRLYGELREVHVIRGPEGGSKGCAFVKFIEHKAALAAIENLNDAVSQHATRPLVVKFADGKKPKGDLGQQQISMYRHGGELMNHMPPHQRMSNQCGQQQLVTAITAVGMHHGALSGYHSQQLGAGYHGYPVRGLGDLAGSNMGYYPGPAMEGQQQQLAPSRSPHGSSGALSSAPLLAQLFSLDSSRVRPPEGPSGANLFIYHLPRDLTDADLATLFATFGNVISAKVFLDKRNSESKGFGFVSFESPENANSAIESMNGFQIGSKRLKVQLKRVMGGPHTSGMSDSPYGNMRHAAPPQHHMHMGHHAGSPYQPQQAPLIHGIQQPQGGLGAASYPPQLPNPGLPAPPMSMGMPAQNRMPTSPPHAGRGGYNHSSYSVSAPTYGHAGGPQQQMLHERSVEGGWQPRGPQRSAVLQPNAQY